MSFLTPLWLLLGLLAIPILVMYMLKLRRREVEVSSTLLWEMLLRDRQANTPWQRIKRNLLLFLQLLILAALTLAMARPTIPAPSVATGSMIVLLDGSISMSATDVEPNRFEAARQAARGLVNSLASGARMTLILVNQQPQVLASGQSDKNTLLATLANIPKDSAPATTAANWQAAFALAGSAGSIGAQSQPPAIVIISDGSLPQQGLPPLPGEVRYIPIGKEGENLAISGLAMRPAGNGAELFARLTNYGRQPHTAILSFYADGQLLDARQVTLPARPAGSPPGQGSSLDINLPGLPGSHTIYKAQLSSSTPQAPVDIFSPDDTAFAIFQPAAQNRVLLASQSDKGNLFLEQVLSALPGISPFRAMLDDQGNFQTPKEQFDVYVLDGLSPDAFPNGNLLLVNPASNNLFQVGAVFTNTSQVQVADQPLARFLDWTDVHVARAQHIQAPDWMQVLVQSEGGPLVLIGEKNGRRLAVLAFDLHASDLPLRVAYPILMSNLLSYLAPQPSLQAAGNLQPGDPVTIRPAVDSQGQALSQIAVSTPNNKIYALRPDLNGLLFTYTNELGVYAVNYLGQASQKTSYFAVNLFNPQESDLQPAGNLYIGQNQVEAANPKNQGQRELWPWLALLGLVILISEWVIYHQRSSLHLISMAGKKLP